MTEKNVYEILDGMFRGALVHLIGTNSSGLNVVEFCVGGFVTTLTKSTQISKVMPHTVDVKFITGTNNHTTYSYLNPEKNLSVNDIVNIEGTRGYAIVTGVDTKNNKATREIKGPVWKKFEDA